jgi:hypothetical protein
VTDATIIVKQADLVEEMAEKARARGDGVDEPGLG